MRILVVCTANMCRSPMGQALLDRRLREAGAPAEVSSCGLLEPGSPAAPDVVDVMAGMGLDLLDHRSRRLSPPLVRQSDLVLAMAREHLREVVVAEPDAFPRTFTLKELVRRGEAAGPRGGAPLEEWLGRVGQGRRARDLLGPSPDDDVADPIGGPPAGYRAAAAEIDGLCARLADLLAG